MSNKYKKHRDEQIIAWLVTIVLLALIVTGVYFGIKYLKAPVAEKVNQVFSHDEPREAPEETVKEEEESQPAEEGIDEEKLSAIFDGQEEEEEGEEQDAKTEDPADPLMDEASGIVEKMSLEQQVAQMFFVTPESITGVETATAAGEKTRLALLEHPVGGVILFERNIESGQQLKTMNENLQRFSQESVSLPLFIGVDEEGGSVTRLAGNEALSGDENESPDGDDADGAPAEDESEDTAEDETEGAAQIKEVPPMSEIKEEKEAYEAGNTIGSYLKYYGFNLDFAPVADVAEDGVKSALGDRIFSSDPEVTAGMVSSYLSGLHDAGVLGCPKHFPGQGSVTEDTHEGRAVTEKDWGDLKEKDLVPFRRAIDEKVKFIMVSHMSVPEVTGDEKPASMSGIVLTEKLRLDMGYKGIAITDAMNMGAVTDGMDSDEAVLLAIKAGADMILMPGDFESAYESVLSAAGDGSISPERIAESVRRIVYVKLFLKENG